MRSGSQGWGNLAKAKELGRLLWLWLEEGRLTPNWLIYLAGVASLVAGLHLVWRGKWPFW